MALLYSDNIAIKDIRPGLKNINVVFIVLEVGAATVTKENREVRTFKVADPTACINVSVWDEPGKLLVPGDIVRLTKGYASVWRQCLTLYSGKNGDIHKIGDFCLNFNEQLNMSEINPNYGINHLPNTSIILNNGASNASVLARSTVSTIQPQPNNVEGTQPKGTACRQTGGQHKSSITSRSNSRGGRINQTRSNNGKSDRK